MQNISAVDLLTAHIRYWKHFLKMLLQVRRTYFNSLKLLTKILREEFPVESILKDDRHVTLRTFNAMYFIAFTRNIQNIQYNIEDDLVIYSFPNSVSEKKVKLYGAVNNGDIVYGFLKEDYNRLPVKGKVVVDVGSNIGDTPIYFVLHGATRVIGIEPFPKNYQFARKNIDMNNLSDRITILLAGCSGKSGNVTINPEYESNFESRINNFAEGVQVPLLTLKDILEKYDVPQDSVLKMDCEGCEYETIMSTSDEILQRFSHIQIEYHLGYKNLKDKLEKCGFRVFVGKPRAAYVINSYLETLQRIIWFPNAKKPVKMSRSQKRRHEIGYTGFIYAVSEKKNTN
jgi:FkbM family methyltransferase